MRKTAVLLTAMVGGVAIQASEAQAQNYLCRTEFLNNVPGAVVTNITTQYYYYPSGTSIDSHEVSLGKGDAGNTFSRNNQDCVDHASHAALVEANGQSQAVTTTTPSQPNNCWTLLHLELNPVSFRSRDMKKGGAKSAQEKFDENFEVIAVDRSTGKRTKLKVKVHDSLEKAVDYLKKEAAEGKKEAAEGK